jgi:hypothetical protein
MKHLTPEQVAEIADQVRRARTEQAKVPWKVLAQVYNRTEQQLRRYVARSVTIIAREEKPLTK